MGLLFYFFRDESGHLRWPLLKFMRQCADRHAQREIRACLHQGLLACPGAAAAVTCASQAIGACSRSLPSLMNAWIAGAMAQAVHVWQSSAMLGIGREAVDAVITGPAC